MDEVCGGLSWFNPRHRVRHSCVECVIHTPPNVSFSYSSTSCIVPVADIEVVVLIVVHSDFAITRFSILIMLSCRVRFLDLSYCMGRRHHSFVLHLLLMHGGCIDKSEQIGKKRTHAR